MPKTLHDIVYGSYDEAYEGTILHCPFCGLGNSAVGFWYDDISRAWRVGCGRCGVSTGISPYIRTKAEAAKNWNKRAG